MDKKARPIIEMLDEFLGDIEELEFLLSQGFGDKAFKKKLDLIIGKARRYRSILVPRAKTDDFESKWVKQPKGNNPALDPDQKVMVLDPKTGEKRVATAEELEELEAQGAPVHLPREREPEIDGFFDEAEDIIK